MIINDDNQYEKPNSMAQVGLVTPTTVYGISGLPQAFFVFIDMRLLKKVGFSQYLMFLPILENIK